MPMKIAAFPWMVVNEVGGFKPIFFTEDHGRLSLPMLDSQFKVLDVHPSWTRTNDLRP